MLTMIFSTITTTTTKAQHADQAQKAWQNKQEKQQMINQSKNLKLEMDKGINDEVFCDSEQ